MKKSSIGRTLRRPECLPTGTESLLQRVLLLHSRQTDRQQRQNKTAFQLSPPLNDRLSSSSMPVFPWERIVVMSRQPPSLPPRDREQAFQCLCIPRLLLPEQGDRLWQKGKISSFYRQDITDRMPPTSSTDTPPSHAQAETAPALFLPPATLFTAGDMHIQCHR
jgi:hypothetical protein